MIAILKWVYLLALATWLGETIFFSFVVAPAVFRAFPVEEAGRVVGAIFPAYYRVAYVCGAVLFVAAAGLWRWTGGGRWAAAAGVVVLMLAASVYAGALIRPRAQALRAQIHEPAAPAAIKAEFDRLHRRAVQLNGAVLLGGLLVSGITAASLRP